MAQTGAKNHILHSIVGATALAFCMCGKAPVIQNETAVIPVISFTKAGVQVSPEGVDSLRVTVESNQLERPQIKTYKFFSGRIISWTLPGDIDITVKVDALAQTGDILFSGQAGPVAISGDSIIIAIEAVWIDTKDTAHTDSAVAVHTNISGEFGATFTSGNGTYSFAWYNATSRCRYFLQIDTGNAGSVQAVITDANDNTVADQSIQASLPDSLRQISGASAAGARGLWTVAIILSNFSGQGSLNCRELQQMEKRAAASF
jgi:hypothetical protein